jgi:hypothetical protein
VLWKAKIMITVLEKIKRSVFRIYYCNFSVKLYSSIFFPHKFWYVLNGVLHTPLKNKHDSVVFAASLPGVNPCLLFQHQIPRMWPSKYVNRRCSPHQCCVLCFPVHGRCSLSREHRGVLPHGRVQFSVVTFSYRTSVKQATVYTNMDTRKLILIHI